MGIFPTRTISVFIVGAVLSVHVAAQPVASKTINPFLPAGKTDVGWPFIRGAHYDGRSDETNLADQWPDEGPPILWTTPIGQGYSAFVAWDERVATQCQTLAGQYVVCFAANTGAEIWRHWYDWPFEPAGIYPGPRATPTYANGRLYFASPNGLIGCLDARTGERLWAMNVQEHFGGRGTGFGYSCSPTVIDGKVVLPVGGQESSMVALDAGNGSIVWQSGDDQASYTPAYPIKFGERQLVIGYLQNALVCHDLDTGKRMWRHVLSGGYDEHSAWPIYAEPYLWISSPFQGGSELLQLTGDPAQPVRSVRKSKLMSNDIFSSILVDGALYGFDLREAQAKAHRPSRGQFRCLDFVTGDERWANGNDQPVRITAPVSSRDKSIGHATVLYANGKLIMLNDTGELILARATAERYEELGRTSVLSGEICWTQPVLYRGRLFIRNQSRAACVYLGKPELLPMSVRNTALTAADIPQHHYVDMASVILGIEPEYAFDIPSDKWLWNWFLVCMAGILGIWILVMGSANTLFAKYVSDSVTQSICWSATFFIGAVGTTIVSGWLDDFIFTWPLSIFVAFQAAVWESTQSRGSGRWASRWRPRLAILFFAASCLIYFLLCRRLSLVFEWVFLCGFAGAMPFLLLGRYVFRERRWSWVWQILTTAAGFSAFYAVAVAVLWLKSS